MIELAFSVLSAILKNKWGQIALIALSVFAFGFYKGFEFERAALKALKAKHQIEMKNSLDARDNEWKAKLSEASADHEERLKEAIEAANAAPAATNQHELEQLCSNPATGSHCRSSNSYRVQGVQKSNVGRN